MLWNIWNHIATWQRYIKVVLFEVPHFTTLYLYISLRCRPTNEDSKFIINNILSDSVILNFIKTSCPESLFAKIAKY